MNARTFATPILAALLAVLTLAPSTWAECAWMLWSRELTPIVGSMPSESWNIVEATESKPTCHASAGRNIQTILTSGVKMFRYERVGNTMAVQRYVANYPNPYPLGTLSSFICLPDTVDPRGPKRSER